MIKIGTDLEIFVGDPSGVKSAVPIMTGRKETPQPIPGLDPINYAMFPDNVALEFNVPASDSKEEFVSVIESALGSISLFLKEKGYSPQILASAYFDESQLNTPESMMFGCSADNNCWLNGEENDRPDATSTNLRTCGGHIHLGSKGVDSVVIARLMDLYLGVPSVIMDNDIERRSLYGRAGSFREKPYGMEYRSLSNFWIKTRKLIEWAYDGAISAYEGAVGNKYIQKGDFTLIEDCINESDREKAEFLINKYNLKLA